VEYDISSYRQVLKRLMDFKRAVGAVDPERSWFGLASVRDSLRLQIQSAMIASDVLFANSTTRQNGRPLCWWWLASHPPTATPSCPG